MIVALVTVLILGVLAVTAAFNRRPVLAAPPRTPCHFPARPDDLQYEVQHSDVVAVTTIQSAALRIAEGGAFTDYLARLDRIIKGQSGVVMDIRMTGNESFLRKAGQYILFLRSTPAGSYYVLGGVDGRFEIENGAAFKFCDDALPGGPYSASGPQGMALDQFTQLVTAN